MCFQVPAKRTCADAFIEPHWCTCLNWEKLELCDKVVKRAALEFVNYLNRYFNITSNNNFL